MPIGLLAAGVPHALKAIESSSVLVIIVLAVANGNENRKVQTTTSLSQIAIDVLNLRTDRDHSDQNTCNYALEVSPISSMVHYKVGNDCLGSLCLDRFHVLPQIMG